MKPEHIAALKDLKSANLQLKLANLLSNETITINDIKTASELQITGEILSGIGSLCYNNVPPFKNRTKEEIAKNRENARELFAEAHLKYNYYLGTYYVAIFTNELINEELKNGKPIEAQEIKKLEDYIQSAINNFLIAKDRGMAKEKVLEGLINLGKDLIESAYYQRAAGIFIGIGKELKESADVNYYLALCFCALKNNKAARLIEDSLNKQYSEQFYQKLFNSSNLDEEYIFFNSFIEQSNVFKKVLMKLVAMSIQKMDEKAIETLLEYGLKLEKLELNSQQLESLNSFEIVKQYKPIQFEPLETLSNSELLDKDISELEALKNTIIEQTNNLLDKSRISYILHINRIISIKTFPNLKSSTLTIKAPAGKNHLNINSIEEIKNAIFFNKIYFKLPDGETRTEIINKLITTLLYEAKRHDFDSEFCVNIRNIISTLGNQYQNYSIKDFQELINRRETRSHNFFGEYPSDDSDNELDKNMGIPQEAIALQEQKIKSLGVGYIKDGIKKLTKTVAKNSFTEREDNLLPRDNIYLPDRKTLFLNFNTRVDIKPLFKNNTVDMTKFEKAKMDLIVLNRLLKNGKTIEQAVEKIVGTKFLVAQYRGVTYLTSKWNAPSRRGHRKLKEEGMAGYSASVYHASQINIFRNFNHEIYKSPQTQNILTIIAEKLQSMLILMRGTNEHIANNYEYDNFAEYVQDFYSKDYKKFFAELESGNLKEYIGKYFLNDKNPFVSTGDRPYHALRYAYGVKPYAGNEDERLRPRWKKDGKAERPYSGKVCVSLHELTDYGQDGPMHLVSLIDQGKCTVVNNILAERETTFPAYIKKGRTVYTHIAKYPSFDKDYHPKYLEKYGLDKELYDSLCIAFKSYPPHSYENRYLKKILGNWLCAYQERKLIEIAYQEAIKQGCILIYKDKEGLYSFDLPEYGIYKGRVNKEEIDLSREYRRNAAG